MKGRFISSPAGRGKGEVKELGNIIAQQQALIFQIQNLRQTREMPLSRLLTGQVIPAEDAT